jgi:MFS family permease
MNDSPTEPMPAGEPPAPRNGALRNTFRALNHPNYRLFFGGQGISLIGTWMTRVATAWFVYEVSGQDWILGIVSFASQIPILLLAPLAGVWVEAKSRLRVLIWTQVFSMLQSFALAALAFSHTIKIWQIIALAAVQGVINAIDTPARQAFVVEIVEDRRDLSNAIALNSSMFNGARLVGPAIAGILYAQVGAGWCFLIDGVSYLAVIAALLAMRVKPHIKPAKPPHIWENLVEGFWYVYRQQPLRALFLLLGLVSIVGIPYSTLMPVFAQKLAGDNHATVASASLPLPLGEGSAGQDFRGENSAIEAASSISPHPNPLPEREGTGKRSIDAEPKSSLPVPKEMSKRGAQIYGFLLAASGLGALCGALFLASRSSVLGLGRVIAANSTMFGVSAIVFAFSPWLWLSMLSSFTAGFGMMAHMAASNTIVQTVVHDDMRARVMGFYTMTVLGMTPIGSLLASGLVVLIGSPYTVALGGGLSLLGALYFIWRLPELRASARPMLERAGVLPVITGIQSATVAGESSVAN